MRSNLDVVAWVVLFTGLTVLWLNVIGLYA